MIALHRGQILVMNDFNIASEASIYRLKTNVIMEHIEQGAANIGYTLIYNSNTELILVLRVLKAANWPPLSRYPPAFTGIKLSL